MHKLNFKNLLVLITSVFFISACQESFKDSYFDRPSWLESPIYQTLEEEGRFSYYLKCVDRTEYVNVLKGAGLYTVFAPNDDAFKSWMQQNNYQSVSDIPDSLANTIVAYSIVYSKWPFDKLSYRFQSNKYEQGAFKRKTAYYLSPYKDEEFGYNWVANETRAGGLSYTVNDYQLNLTSQNYKFLPVFTEEFFSSYPTPLKPEDYNTFFPDVEFTGKNVQGGTIVNSDIQAENGIIHEVSNVNVPLENLEQILKQSQNSSYYALLNQKNSMGDYLFKVYKDASEISPKLLETFQKMVPNENIPQLFVKSYPTDFGVSPIMENFFSEEGSDDTEKNGYTVFIPKNDILESYINSKILKYYNKLSDVPQEVIHTLLNTHMVKGLVWPSTYAEASNFTGEYLNGVGKTGKSFGEAGILDKKIASNGFYYQTAHVIKSRYFETVYSEIYLNPKHTLLNLAFSENLKQDLMKCSLNGYDSEKWTILNFSDDLLKQDGFAYDDLNKYFTHNESSDVGSVSLRLQRLINMHLFPGLSNTSINSTVTGFSTSPLGSTNYNGWGYLVNYNGDMIRYKNNQLQAAGNIEDGTFVNVTKVTDEFNNGYVFNVDRMLEYSPRETKSGADSYKDLPLWDYIKRAKADNANVSQFVDYVEKCLLNASGVLDGIKTEYFYTVLMPNNTAMTNAINNGYLPTLDKITVDNANFNKDELAKATMFVNSHFLQGQVFADDGLENIYPVQPLSPNESMVTTLLKITNDKLDLVNKATQVKVIKVKSGTTWMLRFEPQDIYRGSTQLVDGTIGTGTVAYISGVNRGKVNASATDNFRSNRIACKAVIHEVANFIRFTVKE